MRDRPKVLYVIEDLTGRMMTDKNDRLLIDTNRGELEDRATDVLDVTSLRGFYKVVPFDRRSAR